MIGAYQIKEDRFLKNIHLKPFADFINICKMNSKRRIFSHHEKSLLINVMKNYKEIEEKKTDGVYLKKRSLCGKK